MLRLRDYQQQDVNAIRDAMARGKRAILYVLPTGGGKTVVFSNIAATVAARNKSTMTLVHRIELLRQTSKALGKNGVDHGLISPKFTPDYRKPVQVASVQTLVRRTHMLKKPDLIIIDEAHHATAGTWKKILAEYPNAYIIGVTATPCRGDGVGLGVQAGGIFDHLIEGPTTKQLIEKGYLVRPVIYAPVEKLDLRSVHIVAGDYNKAEIADVVDKPKITGNAVAHYRKLCSGAPAVAFCINVAHAEHVAEEFRAAGYRAYSVDGTMDDDTRSRILNGLGNGQVQVVCSCDLISEGTDIPAIQCAILLRPTKSLGLFIQQCGRALRILDGKDKAIILDHVGNTLTHGMPHEEREWSLDGVKKVKGKRDAAVRVNVRQCPNCYAMHAPAPSCPECGMVYSTDVDIEEIYGELTEITPAEERLLKRKKQIEVGSAQSLEELIAIGRARGYKDGWAKHVWAGKQAKLAPAQ